MQKYVLTELDSGERVISERVPSVRSVSIGFWIGAGSRDERDDRAGVSHFIEHLLFKGSRSYDAQQIAETFDAMGAELNAATSREHTMVYSRVPDRHLEEALEVMTDMVFAPAFAELDQEREVVLEEIAMYEDTPHELVHDLFSEAVFGSHALGRPVIGTADVISTSVAGRSPRTTARCTPAANIVVAAAGNVQHDAFVSLLERFERKSAAGAGGPRVRRPLTQAPPPSLRFERKDTEQYHLCLGAPGISRSDRRRFAASLLDSILGGSASSRLFQEIREKRGMAYSVYTFASQYTDTGLIGIYVGTREENLATCVEICSEQIGELADGKFRKGELERAKESIKGRIMLSMESTSNRMSRLGKSLITDTELLSFERIIAEIDAVDPDAVAELAGVLLGARSSLRSVRRAERGPLPRGDRQRRRAEGRMKIALFGAEGKVGAALQPVLERSGHEVKAIEIGDEPDVRGLDAAVDFTTPEAAARNVRAALEQGVSCVVGTTGWDPQPLHELAAANGLRLFVAPNFSIGAVLMMRFAQQAAAFFPRAEVIELHNEAKKDAPSGTARMTAELIGGDTVVHSVRLPGLVAHQEVIFGSEGQLLTIRHDTTARESFAEGVLLALAKLDSLPPGLTVGLDSLL